MRAAIMPFRRMAVLVGAAVLLAACSSHHTGRQQTTSRPQTIQTVAARIGCNNYQRDPTIAPASTESGSCDLLGGLVTAQLYAMPNHAAGAYLVEIAKEQGVAAKDITWYGNVLVVTDAP